MVLVLMVLTGSPPLLGSDPEGPCRFGGFAVGGRRCLVGRPPMLAAARVSHPAPRRMWRCGIITAHYEQVTEQHADCDPRRRNGDPSGAAAPEAADRSRQRPDDH